MRFLIILLIAFSSNAFSCDCKKVLNPYNEAVLESGTPEFFLAEIKSVSKIKIGKIIYFEYEIIVKKKYSIRDDNKTLKLVTRANKCKTEFEIGESYLIGASRDHEKRLFTDQCHFKRNSKSARDYLAFLDERYH